MKLSKESWELLFRARDYTEIICDELETNDETNYENADNDPITHLYNALDALNLAIEKME